MHHLMVWFTSIMKDTSNYNPAAFELGSYEFGEHSVALMLGHGTTTRAMLSSMVARAISIALLTMSWLVLCC